MLPLAVNVFADITLALLILPPLPLVTILPAVTLPDATKVLALITLTLLILPPEPLLNRLPTVVLPVAFSVPAILTPVPVTTTILALPTALIVMLPLAVAILTLLLPLLMLLVLPELTVAQLNVPDPSVCKYCPDVPPVICTLATGPKLTLLAPVKLAVPVLVIPVSVPTLVIFGCAAVVTVPAVVALVAVVALLAVP